MARRGMSTVQNNWQIFLQEMDGNQARRWKTAARQSSVEIISIEEQGIEAKVKWFGGGTGKRVFSVRIPTISWWVPYRHEVATWLARRTDWQAAFLANEWNEDFMDLADSAGLNLFPKADFLNRIQREAVCSCSNPDQPCVHMMSVLDNVMKEQITNPARALEYVGLPFTALLNDAHALTAGWVHSRLIENQNSDTKDVERPYSSLTSVDVLDKKQLETALDGKRAGISTWSQEAELLARLRTWSVPVKEDNTQFPVKISHQRINRWRDSFLQR